MSVAVGVAKKVELKARFAEVELDPRLALELLKQGGPDFDDPQQASAARMDVRHKIYGRKASDAPKDNLVK